MKIHGTAKGAALSTKDFGVAFSVAAQAVTTCQNVTNNDGDTSLGGAGGKIILIGTHIATTNPIIGKNLTGATFTIKDYSGTNIGNGYAYIYNDDVLKATSTDSKDWSTLTGDWEDITWTFAGHTIAENDDIVIGTATTPITGEILFKACSPAQYTNSYMIYDHTVSGWVEKTDRNTQYCAITIG